MQTSVAQPGEPRQHRRAHAQLLGRRRRPEEQRRRQRRRRHLAELGRQRQLDRGHRRGQRALRRRRLRHLRRRAPAPSRSTTASARSRASGMQFAADGYVSRATPIELVGDPTASSASATAPTAGAGITATIAARADRRLAAAQDRPRHARSRRAANSYTGGTAIDGGVVEIAADANLGAPGGRAELRRRHAPRVDCLVELDTGRAPRRSAAGGGHLRDRPQASTLIQQSGDRGRRAAHQGRRRHAGHDRHAARYTGGTTIAGGRCSSATAAPRARSSATCVNNGTLVFDRSDTLTPSPARSAGPAPCARPAPARPILGGANSYTGATHGQRRHAGRLARADVFSAASAIRVGAGGTLDLADFDQTRRAARQRRPRLARPGAGHPADRRRRLCGRGRRAALHHRARRRRRPPPTG